MSTIDNAAGGRGETVSDILDALRRRWIIVVGIVIVCLAVGVVHYERAAKTYKATASVTFGSSSLTGALLQITSGSGDPQIDAATNQLIAESPAVAANVIKALHLDETPSELLGQVSVQVVDNADVLAIAATSGDPAFAARVANAFAEQYLAFQASSQESQINAAQTQLQQEINATPAGSADRTDLEASLQRLEELRATAASGGEVIGPATPPTSPTGLSLSTTLIISLLIGLALAFSVVVLLESRDRRVRSVAGFEREYDLPTLTGIPQSVFDASAQGEGNERLEPFRILRSALDFVAVTRPLHSLLVTSAAPDEGKTTVAVNLARAYALTGRPVVLVELDLRAPSFASHFDLPPDGGVTSALIGRADAHDLLVEPLVPNLAVLPAGRLPPNPAELLASPMLGELLADLQTPDGIVIVDAPPLNPVADAQSLLSNPHVNGALIVARANSTTLDDVRRARATLDRFGDRAVGLVVTGLRDSDRYGYGYGAEPFVDAAEPLARNGATPAAGSTRARLRR